MDRVAAEVAQEIGVLLQHRHVDAGTREQKASIMPAGPAPAMQQRVFSVSAIDPLQTSADPDHPLASPCSGEQRDAENEHHGGRGDFDAAKASEP